MAKVTKIIINHKYNPINVEILIKGEMIPFNIYIKRYNDFVVIIEEGTILEEGLIEKLMKNETIYIDHHDSDKLSDYISHHNSVTLLDHSEKAEDPISEALNITEKNKHIGVLKRKLFFVYSTTAKLAHYLFEKEMKIFIEMPCIPVYVKSLIL